MVIDDQPVVLSEFEPVTKPMVQGIWFAAIQHKGSSRWILSGGYASKPELMTYLQGSANYFDAARIFNIALPVE